LGKSAGNYQVNDPLDLLLLLTLQPVSGTLVLESWWPICDTKAEVEQKMIDYVVHA